MAKRALISVSDKRGLVEFAKGLLEQGFELVASGGTARILAEQGVDVTDVATITGMPDLLDGRVKTLHPAIHAGILARPTPGDHEELSKHGFAAIDLVICNLYPFRRTAANPSATMEDAIEQIDIGGVALLRAAAKNHARVTVVTDPSDYQEVLADVVQGGPSDHQRQKLAAKAFSLTRDYDAAIASFLADGRAGDGMPDTLQLSLPRIQLLRYGENPHQSAALYAQGDGSGPLGGTLLAGKPLSFNNLLDLDSAWSAVTSFTEPAVVIVKHLSPCGMAIGESLASAFLGALASDPVSAFGGVIGVNRPVGMGFVEALVEEKLFVEAIVAPGFTSQVAAWFAAKKPDCRLLEVLRTKLDPLELRSVQAGVLVQQRDVDGLPVSSWRVVTEREPDEKEWSALRFAWRACRHVKSNAIVLATMEATVGIGGGLPSRVDAVALAAAKAGPRAHGAVMASDAFFPFPDGVEAGARAGVTAIVQPGGSIRDDVIIAAANRLQLAMVFTGSRHFRH